MIRSTLTGMYLHALDLLVLSSPFLLDLGLSKASMAMTFVAGPISGLLVQPAIGMLADRSTHSWGRRRPVMIAATMVTCFFVLLFGFARVLPRFLGIEGATPLVAVVGIWGIDFAVNAVMAVDRSLLFDMLPAAQQASANAWCLRMGAFGAILGFFVGDIDLVSRFPFSWMHGMLKDGTKTPNEAQVRCLALLTVFFMFTSHMLTAWAAVEQTLVLADSREARLQSPAGILALVKKSTRQFYDLARELSAPLKEVFRIQIASWICLFPLLFYATEWVSSVAVSAYLAGEGRSRKIEDVRAEGTRLGSHAMFLQALACLAFSALLPLFLSADHSSKAGPTGHSDSLKWVPAGLRGFLKKLQALLLHVTQAGGGVSLVTFWVVAHFYIAGITWLSWPVKAFHSINGATTLIVMTGYTWAVVNWVPFTLIGIFIQMSSEQQQTSSTADGYRAVPNDAERPQGSSGYGGAGTSLRLSISDTQASTHKTKSRNEDDGDAEDDEEAFLPSFDPTSDASRQATAHDDSSFSHQESSSSAPLDGSTSDPSNAGAILGLHNVAIVMPQLLVSILASLIFAILDGPSSPTPVAGSPPSAGKGAPVHQATADGVAHRGAMVGRALAEAILSRAAAAAAAGASKGGDQAGAGAGSQEEGWDSVGLVMRLGGLSSIAAGILTIRLRRRWGAYIQDASRR